MRQTAATHAIRLSASSSGAPRVSIGAGQCIESERSNRIMAINERKNSPTLSPVMIKYTKTFKDDWQSLTNSNEKDKIQMF